MANDYTVLDSTASTQSFKSTDNAGVHTPHHNVDSSALPTGASTAANQTTANNLLTTIDADTGGILTSVQLLDNAISGSEMQVDIVAALPAGSNLIGSVVSFSPVFTVTLSTDTSAYASGDVIADSQVLTNIMRASDSTGILQSVTVIDQADQKVAMTLYFLSANVTIGTENAAPSISDANSLNILGHVEIAAADWQDLGGTAVACIKGIGLGLAPASGTRNVYIAVVNGTGTPTFAADSLVARLTVLQD